MFSGTVPKSPMPDHPSAVSVERQGQHDYSDGNSDGGKQFELELLPMEGTPAGCNRPQDSG